MNNPQPAHGQGPHLMLSSYHHLQALGSSALLLMMTFAGQTFIIYELLGNRQDSGPKVFPAVTQLSFRWVSVQEPHKANPTRCGRWFCYWASSIWGWSFKTVVSPYPPILCYLEPGFVVVLSWLSGLENTSVARSQNGGWVTVFAVTEHWKMNRTTKTSAVKRLLNYMLFALWGKALSH